MFRSRRRIGVYSYHFFWADDIYGNFLGMAVGRTNKRSARSYRQSAGPGVLRSKLGLPAGISAAGYQNSRPANSRSRPTTSQPDCAVQNKRRRYRLGSPSATTGCAEPSGQAGLPAADMRWRRLLFPAAVNALGDRGDGMSTEVWWTPAYPFKSSLTGQAPPARRRMGGARQAMDPADRLRPVVGVGRRRCRTRSGQRLAARCDRRPRHGDGGRTRGSGQPDQERRGDLAVAGNGVNRAASQIRAPDRA